MSTTLLTIPDVAKELRISENTVYKMIAAGDLRAIDMAVPGARKSKTRVREDDLADFIKARTREARAS